MPAYPKFCRRPEVRRGTVGQFDHRLPAQRVLSIKEPMLYVSDSTPASQKLAMISQVASRASADLKDSQANTGQAHVTPAESK